ncbi:MAG TPA: alpha/beta hydrolase [Bryobacteraceae bacterium]|nr:alpha/beta hydrolase [Bryobacteraceae bacterium]
MVAFMQPNESYVTVSDGVRLFCQHVGDHAAALLIPNALYLFEDFRRLAARRTLIFFDLRNRGRSDAVVDPSKLRRGIHEDVDDLDAVRRHFGFDTVDVLGHSYLGLTVTLYAMKYSEHVNRVVQIGPAPPRAGTQYPAHLAGADSVLSDVLGKMGQLYGQTGADPRESCRKIWALLRMLYVGDPADAAKLHWEPCDVPNELNFMRYWNAHVLPSIQQLELGAPDYARVKAPVLTIHGAKDRSAPYGGGREWAMLLPDARLLTIKSAAHVPWIEEPEAVFGAIATFLDGAWPESVEKVTVLDPGGTAGAPPLR